MDGLDELWIGHPSRGETRTSLPQPARRQILNALDYKEEIHRTSVSQANEDARFATGAAGGPGLWLADKKRLRPETTEPFFG